MEPGRTVSASNEAGWSATLAGLGNIGSQSVQALARIPGLKRLNLVDPDIYEVKNLVTQAIGPEAVGRAKVDAAAELLRRIRPDLAVQTYQDRLEHVPWGALRADVFLGCLDTKVARRDLNRIARRLGANYVDAGVTGPSLLARVRVFPAPGETCLECGWGRADYANLEVGYACQGGEALSAETHSPAYLGQLAAAMQVLECHRLQSGAGEGEEAGQAFELLIDGANRKYFHSRFRPNPACRFSHGLARPEMIRSRPEQVKLADVLSPGMALEAEGDVFVRDLVCPGCQSRQPALIRRRALRVEGRACAGCGESMQPLGFTMQDELELAALTGTEAGTSFAAAGFLPGDVFRVRKQNEVTQSRESFYYELELEHQPA